MVDHAGLDAERRPQLEFAAISAEHEQLAGVAFEHRRQQLRRSLHHPLEMQFGEGLLAEAAHRLLVAHLLERCLAAVGGRHVAHVGGRDRRALLVLEGRQADLDRELAAVAPLPGQAHADTHRPRIGVRHEVGAVLVVHSTEALRHQRLQRQAHHAAFVVAEHGLGASVHANDAAARIDDHDAVRRCLDQLSMDVAHGRCASGAVSRRTSAVSR